MLGLVRKTPVGKCEITKLMEMASMKQTYGKQQRTAEKIWRQDYFVVDVQFSRRPQGQVVLGRNFSGGKEEREGYDFQREDGFGKLSLVGRRDLKDTGSVRGLFFASHFTSSDQFPSVLSCEQLTAWERNALLYSVPISSTTLQVIKSKRVGRGL